MRWGLKGKGTWITVYTNPGHAFAVIAGLRLDTSTGGITSRKIDAHRRARPALARRPAQHARLQGAPPARALSPG